MNDYFCNGVYGIKLSSLPSLEPIVARILQHAAPDGLINDALTRRYTAEVRETIRELYRVVAPTGAALHWTGSADSHPGRNNIGPGEIIYGLGMFRRPWMFPVIDPSFRRRSKLYAWVTATT